MRSHILIATAAFFLFVISFPAGCSRPQRESSLGRPAQANHADAASPSQATQPADQDAAQASDAGAAAAPTRVAQQPAAGQPGGNASGGRADWPAFLGPNANGIAPGTGINKNWGQNPPRTLWKVSLSDRGYAGPSVADGKVFIIDHRGSEDVVRAIDLETGRDVWSFAYPDTDRFNYGYARSTPVFANGRLYTLSRLGLLHCLDAATGAVHWSRNIFSEFQGKRPQWDYSGSPLIDSGRLIVTPGGNTGVAALDPQTGSTIWTGGVGGLAGYATPVSAVINGRHQYVIFAGEALYGVDAETGRTIWQTPWKTSYDVNAATPIVVDDFVYITSGYGVGSGLFRINGANVSAVWKSKEIQAQFNSPVYYNNFIYGIGDPGNLVCLNPQNGTAMWKQPGFEKGGIVITDGVIIAVNGRDGDVVMAEAEHGGYRELGRIKPLGGQSWTAPIVAHGRLIVRNTQEMVCLDLR